MTRLTAQFDTSHTSTLLTTVVLLLHHQIEFVQSVAAGAVLLLIIAQGLEQTDHRHTTFMLELLHRYMLLRTT